MSPTALRASVILRATIGLLLTIHGVYRVYDGGVTGFGVFLDAQHVPLGPAVAWLITIVEIVGGPALILGFLVRPLCAWFAVELTMGILLVHASDGWFVVGGGRNGMEFSVLLIICLAVIAMLDSARREATTS
ncbi:MAG TPA: DoxX family protein [Gemmatimonadales bacterium]|jgi:putative oxidoreductase|nr:DoxX family protein [Gemmatimonadales bacterium]